MANLKKTNSNSEITMEIKEEIGNVGDKLVLKLISWNGATAKYDLRNWYTDKEGNQRYGKGITLTKDEAKDLMNLLNSQNL